jgi:DNA polymerase-3 subunit alpha
MSKHFTNLHVHTDFSLLDGAISLKRLVKYGKEHELKALAISDHGNIFGAVKFFQLCKKEHIKPILGMEAYLTQDAHVKDADNRYYHLMLIVQNKVGYRNLCKLIAYAYKEGFYFKPRIDYRMLAQHSEGLITTTACLGGHIPKLLMSDKAEAAHAQVDWFLEHFGAERFYLEIQPEDQAEQQVLNQKLYELSAQKNLQLVATGDSHYVAPEDHEAHEIMLSIQTHDRIDNPNRYTFGDCRVQLRNTQQMLDLFPDHPEAIWNSGTIADSCDFDFETDKLFFPKFAIPQEHTQESYFKLLCERGLQELKERGAFDAAQFDAYHQRLMVEVDLITSMGFVGYFLVVSDFIQWAHRNGIPVGPGRGSAAGSLVAWALQITNIDPLKYNLLFERFLNPERVTMPDIDIDFCIEGRDTVINYVRDKYGHDKVCHIITFGTMLAKGVIKDVARTLGFPFEDANAITNLIPDQLKITLDEAIEQEPRLKELIESNPKAQKLFTIAKKLEGLTRHASKHAAGIVISPEPIDEVLPVYVPPKSDELVAQYAMSELESIGFLKIDFLGLKNLTLIKNVITQIKQNHGITLDMDKIPLDDPKAFALICEGQTSGVFQLESSGLKEVLRKLQPAAFEDIIAVNALYRPGPLGSGMVDDFIERKHGRQKITYLFPELEPILQETYGVIVYQEQVMKISSTIAGYTLGQADILRRAMGKKKAEVMAEQKKIFLEGANKLNFNEQKAGELFELMAYFAGYGFNKSHSAAYAMIAYQTAYLKANYPAEFMACLISLEATHADKMSFYLQEAKEMGLGILPPNINRSLVDFSVCEGNILFGLHGIKNVGLTAIENLIAEREKKGPFKDLFDFCTRIDLRVCNKRVVENLICAGAFDELPGSRAQQFNELATIMEKAVAYKKDKATGQMGLFGAPATQKDDNEGYAFAPCPAWSNRDTLEKEKEVIGFYLSAHPLDSYRKQIKWFQPQSFQDILKKSQEASSEVEPIALLCGLLKSRKDIVTKKGDRMAFVQLEDGEHVAEIILFPKTFSAVEQWLDEYHVFFCKGAVDTADPRKLKIKANQMVPAELMLTNWQPIQHAIFELPPAINETLLSTMREQFKPGPIATSCLFIDQGKKLRLSCKQTIALNDDMLAQMSKLKVKTRIVI